MDEPDLQQLRINLEWLWSHGVCAVSIGEPMKTETKFPIKEFIEDLIKPDFPVPSLPELPEMIYDATHPKADTRKFVCAECESPADLIGGVWRHKEPPQEYIAQTFCSCYGYPLKHIVPAVQPATDTGKAPLPGLTEDDLRHHELQLALEEKQEAPLEAERKDAIELVRLTALGLGAEIDRLRKQLAEQEQQVERLVRAANDAAAIPTPETITKLRAVLAAFTEVK
jgi:hypothetical protein